MSADAFVADLQYVTLRHLRGPDACGMPAFQYNLSEMAPGRVIQARFARHMDGGQIEMDERLVCDSCGAAIDPQQCAAIIEV